MMRSCSRKGRNSQRSGRSKSHKLYIVPGDVPEKRLIGLHAAGPRVARDAVLPPVCVATETGIYNEVIARCKGGMGDAGGNREYAPAIVHKITLFMQIKNCDNS